MKLSMHMVERWLARYRPTAIIRSGERRIVGARLFTDDAPSEGDYLYVGRNEEFLGGKSRETLVMFHEDVLSIQSDDVNRIFNDVLAAFDFYNDLEAQLLQGASMDHPEQRILSACEDLIGPSFIYSNDLRMLAVSRNYDRGYVNDFWEYTVLGRKDRARDTILSAKTLLGLTAARHSMFEFREPAAAPYDYGIYNTYCNAAGNPIGFMVNSSDRPITPYERDISAIIVSALDAAQRSAALPRRLDGSNSPDEVMLSKLLDAAAGSTGANAVLEACEYLRTMKGVRDGMAYQLFASSPVDTYLLPALKREIYDALEDRVVTRMGRQVVVMAWDRAGDAAQLLSVVTERCRFLTARAHACLGASNPFSRLADAWLYLPQAREAARCGGVRPAAVHADAPACPSAAASSRRGDGPVPRQREEASSDNGGEGETAANAREGQVVGFARAAVPYLLRCDDARMRRAALHPAVAELQAFDRANDAVLTDTLRVYLLCERSVKRASELLYVHRNTVTYRIEQAREAATFDLDDLRDRTWLLVSLLVAQGAREGA